MSASRTKSARVRAVRSKTRAESRSTPARAKATRSPSSQAQQAAATPPTRLSALQGCIVHGRDGQRLGRVLEVRSPGRAETEPVHVTREIAALLVGRRGLLDRLGWLQPERAAIPVEALAWRDGRLHVVLELPPEKPP